MATEHEKLSKAYSRALGRSMKYWAIWDDLMEQGKGNSEEAQDARKKYLEAEEEMANISARQGKQQEENRV